MPRSSPAFPIDDRPSSDSMARAYALAQVELVVLELSLAYRSASAREAPGLARSVDVATAFLRRRRADFASAGGSALGGDPRPSTPEREEVTPDPE